jgi:hypothetical protein
MRIYYFEHILFLFTPSGENLSRQYISKVVNNGKRMKPFSVSSSLDKFVSYL